MSSAAVVLLASLATAGSTEPPAEPHPTDAPELVDTGAPPPWQSAPAPWVSPLELEGLAAYHRYQRIAHVGTPFFAAGLALGTWSVWAFEVGRINAGQEAFGIVGGGLLAAGGGAAMTWGSYNAVSRLYDGRPPPLAIAAGTTGYALLAISSAFYVTGVTAFFFWPPLIAIAGIGLPFTAAAGIPAAIQTAVNPAIRRRWEKEHTTVRAFPWTDPRSGASGLALGARF